MAEPTEVASFIHNQEVISFLASSHHLLGVDTELMSQINVSVSDISKKINDIFQTKLKQNPSMTF